jgi:hypothetical protein
MRAGAKAEKNEGFESRIDDCTVGIRDSNSQFCFLLSAICHAVRASAEIDIFRLRTFDLVQP